MNSPNIADVKHKEPIVPFKGDANIGDGKVELFEAMRLDDDVLFGTCPSVAARVRPVLRAEQRDLALSRDRPVEGAFQIEESALGATEPRACSG